MMPLDKNKVYIIHQPDKFVIKTMYCHEGKTNWVLEYSNHKGVRDVLDEWTASYYLSKHIDCKLEILDRDVYFFTKELVS